MAQARDMNVPPTTETRLVIALPASAGGIVSYASVAEAQAAITDEMIAEAISLAGAWSDLADHDVEGELDQLRHDVPPSPPVVL